MIKIPSDIMASNKGIIENPLVRFLLESLQGYEQKIFQLEAEIRRLKGHSPKPDIPKSKLEKPLSKSGEDIKKNSLY